MNSFQRVKKFNDRWLLRQSQSKSVVASYGFDGDTELTPQDLAKVLKRYEEMERFIEEVAERRHNDVDFAIRRARQILDRSTNGLVPLKLDD